MTSVDDPVRLLALRQTALLDSPAEEAFDRFTRLAARLLHAPIALVSLIDGGRQFFKSLLGLAEPIAVAPETPLSHSFCQHAVERAVPLVVEDARAHPLVRDDLAVEALGATYLGIPLATADGIVLRSLRVADHGARRCTAEEDAGGHRVERSNSAGRMRGRSRQPPMTHASSSGRASAADETARSTRYGTDRTQPTMSRQRYARPRDDPSLRGRATFARRRRRGVAIARRPAPWV